VEEFKYLGTTLTNQNSIQEEIKSNYAEEQQLGKQVAVQRNIRP
jgi:hypothetical protein